MITTAEEMYVAFLHGIQKEDQEGVPAEKFNFWINKAQEDWQTERSRLFDTEQKKIDDLYLLRTERIIPINGSITVQANASLRIFSDASGTFVVTEETYFDIAGLTFYAKAGNTGTINSVTGVVAGAIVGDVFYAKVLYSQFNDITNFIVISITIGGTLISTHTGTKVTNDSGYVTFNTDTGQSIGTTPDESVTDYRFLIPNGYPNPKYLRLLSVQFKITYIDNALFSDGVSNWLKAEILKGDQRAEVYQNAYRYPTDEKPYYRMLGDFIEFINETSSTPLQMKMEYLRYANAIRYVEPGSAQVAINCMFLPIQQKEIVDMAVRMYIEATQNPRYQTQIVEEQIKDKFE